jgi:hypothetical protein
MSRFHDYDRRGHGYRMMLGALPQQQLNTFKIFRAIGVCAAAPAETTTKIFFFAMGGSQEYWLGGS